jgi:hypothetical protein
MHARRFGRAQTPAMAARTQRVRRPGGVDVSMLSERDPTARPRSDDPPGRHVSAGARPAAKPLAPSGATAGVTDGAAPENPASYEPRPSIRSPARAGRHRQTELTGPLAVKLPVGAEAQCIPRAVSRILDPCAASMGSSLRARHDVSPSPTFEGTSSSGCPFRCCELMQVQGGPRGPPRRRRAASAARPAASYAARTRR